MKIHMKEVTKTYSGENNCACGCGGTYAYMPGNNPEGYEVKPNERTAKMRVNKINKAFAEGKNVQTYNYIDMVIFELENEEGTRVVRVYCYKDTREVSK